MNRRISIIAGLIAISCLLRVVAAGSISARDLEFSRFSIRHHEDGTVSRGKLSKVQPINGTLCQRWVHFHPNGQVKQMQLAKAAVLQGVPVPPDSTVFLTSDGKLRTVWFAKDTSIQGITVRGGGKISTGFHPNGKTASFFLRQPAILDGVPCRASLFKPVLLHPNGRLKSASLNRATLIQGKAWKKGDVVKFNTSGKLLPH